MKEQLNTHQLISVNKIQETIVPLQNFMTGRKHRADFRTYLYDRRWRELKMLLEEIVKVRENETSVIKEEIKFLSCLKD